MRSGDRNETERTAVAFIGLGAMGGRMAIRLLDAGHRLVVWNRTRARAQPLLDAGATLAESPADAARQAEVVITMVADPAALEAVTSGPDGVLAGLRPGATLIEMSTVGPGAIARLAAHLPPDTGLLDAPVLGSIGEAESGSLTIFVGGSIALAERLMPLLSALGTPLYVGDSGAGAAAKLVANATLITTLGALGEALALAHGLGLSRETAYRILQKTPLGAQAERRREAIETGLYPPRFPLALARKDAALIGEAAAAAGVDLRLTTAAEAWLAEAQTAGLGGSDYAAVLAVILNAGKGSFPDQ